MFKIIRVQDVIKLQKAYELTLRLRSQIIGIIYDMKQYTGFAEIDFPYQEVSDKKQTATLIIPEPLPGMKELAAAVEKHWITMIHNVIEKESITGIPKFQKAMVMIEVTTPRGTDNPRVWDTSNRAINLIINNLEGIFFRDDLCDTNGTRLLSASQRSNRSCFRSGVAGSR